MPRSRLSLGRVPPSEPHADADAGVALAAAGLRGGGAWGWLWPRRRRGGSLAVAIRGWLRLRSGRTEDGCREDRSRGTSGQVQPGRRLSAEGRDVRGAVTVSSWVSHAKSRHPPPGPHTSLLQALSGHRRHDARVLVSVARKRERSRLLSYARSSGVHGGGTRHTCRCALGTSERYRRRSAGQRAGQVREPPGCCESPEAGSRARFSRRIRSQFAERADRRPGPQVSAPAR